ncbi:dienelactone hydrolase family protein [Ferruginivarius sediminum]|uniref:Dienelactone hydrolase family protein n=1 Tax=Ferruginivarius sediminum TaxID=2661937 RepID=A0A369TCH6_9PROT|nr:dienelactone hydrolase family protein [Ferruginivarius sediminum]RDD63033.1 dienelactone hydrolase family protein [Ferruginivarius sediminum]
MTEIPRRQILTGLASLPLAAVLADPRLARAAAAELQEVTIETAGGRSVSAALALPRETPAPAVLLIHEWWGLNDQIKAVAAELAAKHGYVALAVDLYGGEVAETPEKARALMGAVDDEAATDALASWIAWLRRHDKTTDKVGTVGWCFGGGWSLNASIAAPVDATVIYYGRVTRPAADLKRLQGPVLGHFATQDRWIDEAMVGGFASEMQAAGKTLEAHWYTADHAFANPTGARYDKEDAQLAWSRTLTFFSRHLRG